MTTASNCIEALAPVDTSHVPVVEKIIWPEGYDPAKSKFFVHNEIIIEDPPEVVWSILIDALSWESWYIGAKSVAFEKASDSLINSGTTFFWETMGLKFRSAIKQYEPYRILAWESRKRSIQGYHVWLIVRTQNGCKVITEESQNGWLTFFEKIFQKNKLKRLHDVWLIELKRKSEEKIK